MTEQNSKISFIRQSSTQDLVQKYKDDMLKAYQNSKNNIPDNTAAPIPAQELKPKEVIPFNSSIHKQEETPTNDQQSEVENGFLIIEVTTANGTIPIENAFITILHDDGNKKFVVRFVTTGRNGETPLIPLSAPQNWLFQKAANDKTFFTYNITVSADNFYPIEKLHIPIFPTVKTIQPVDLMPISQYEKQG